MTENTPSAFVQILTGLLYGPPIWVWPLFVLLLFVGWRASRVRQTTMILYYFLPLMGLLTVQSVSSLPQAGPAWMAFGLCYILAVVIFFRRQTRWVLYKSNGTVRLVGEWVTMCAVMIVFWANFARGLLSDVAPQLYSQVWFCVVFAGIVGIAGGSFLGRSARIIWMPQTSGNAKAGPSAG
jgi:hypothetical protein